MVKEKRKEEVKMVNNERLCLLSFIIRIKALIEAR